MSVSTKKTNIHIRWYYFKYQILKHSLVTKLHFSKCKNYSSFEFKMTMYQVMILRIFWLVPKYTTQVYSSKFLSYKLDLIIIKFSKIQFPHCTFKASIINKYPHPLVKFRHLSLAYERKRNWNQITKRPNTLLYFK